MPRMWLRLAFGDETDELWVAIVADEGPALLGLFLAVVGRLSSLLHQRLGIFEIAVDGLNGIADAVLL